jgi:class 3 adenylate cyclase
VNVTTPDQLAVEAIGTGIALADAETWEIVYENPRFREWLAPDPGEADSLEARLVGLDGDRARTRLSRGRAYRYETEVQHGVRTVSLLVELRTQEIEVDRYLVAEARNISKQKEAEYMLDSYSRMVEKKTRELEKEKERVEKLLLNVMPRSVYEELKEFGTTAPQVFDEVSVLMLDFVGFTEMAISQEPAALIAELNDIFTAFDRIVELFGCERIKTIGDAYMAVSGLPQPTPEHASNLAKVALRMQRYIERRNQNSPHQWKARIGIGCGSVIGSIVGVQKYVYDIFGPAVNMASRLEQVADAGEIMLSPATYEQIRDDFVIVERGEVELKGFGLQPLRTLEGEVKKDR